MPYSTISELPNSVKNSLTPEQEKTFLAAFNSALHEYGNEKEAFKVAWSAVKKAKKKSMDSVETVKRYDSVAFSSKPTKNAQGFLKAFANLSRVGVFSYTNADGSTRRELRHPDEVFNTDVLDSLKSAPVTLGHPVDEKGYVLVNAKNAKKYTVGMLGEQINTDEKFLSSGITVMDANAIEEIEKGHRREISLGYSCDLVNEPGIWNGEQYDCKQTNIVYNHAAIVAKGRAGHEVAIRMDSSDAVTQYLDEETKEEVKMETQLTNVDGVDFDLPKSAAQAIELAFEKKAKELSEMKASFESTKGQLDAMKEDLAKANQMRMDAEDPKRVQEAVAARVALLAKAAKVLGSDDVSELTDRQVKEAAICKVSPSIKLDSESDDYVNGRFDMVIESHKNQQESLANTVKAAESIATGASDKPDAAKIKQLKLDAYNGAWKKSLNK